MGQAGTTVRRRWGRAGVWGRTREKTASASKSIDIDGVLLYPWYGLCVKKVWTKNRRGETRCIGAWIVDMPGTEAVSSSACPIMT